MRYKKQNKTKLFLKIFLLIIIIGTMAGIACVGIFVSGVEKIDPHSIYTHLEQSSYIYDNNGAQIDTIFYDENRKIVSISEIPLNVRNAFISIEDKTFYRHHGFNFRRMAGAVLNKLTGKSENIQGTSTITQQLARNVFLSDIKEERTIKRKATEMVYAHELEAALSKDEILEAYLNTIYLGYGCYGIHSAAKTYFGKEPSELSLSEAALLATLPQAPDNYALIQNEKTDNNVELANGLYANKSCENRRDLVLDLMIEQEYITEADKENAEVPVEDALHPAFKNHDSIFTYFKDYLIDQVKADLIKQYSLSDKDAEKLIYTGGISIYSTINSDAQQVIYNEFQNDDNFPWNAGDKDTQGAMVITEIGTGKVLAMMGGRSISGEKLFNRAVSPRQPGSSIKPLSVYSAALQKSYDYAARDEKFRYTNHKIDKQGTSGYGDYITVSSYIKDEPTYINGEKWPLNATRTYSGGRNFRTAIQQSINTCAVKLLYQIGIEYSITTLEKYNFASLVTEGGHNDVNAAALALGAMTEGVSPTEMALAYGVFPNGGNLNKPIAYTEVRDPEGNILLSSNIETKQVLDEGVAWIMTDVLKSVVTRGLGSPASIYDVQVGGKTGTTDNAADLWFCGFTPSCSAALWIGTDDNSEMNAQSSVAARLWGKIMDQIPEAKRGEYKDAPSNVIQKNGEYYTKGTEPSYVYTEKKQPEPKVESETSRDDFVKEFTGGSSESNSRNQWILDWQDAN